jgi:hypothetical protein
MRDDQPVVVEAMVPPRAATAVDILQGRDRPAREANEEAGEAPRLLLGPGEHTVERIDAAGEPGGRRLVAARRISKPLRRRQVWRKAAGAERHGDARGRLVRLFLIRVRCDRRPADDAEGCGPFLLLARIARRGGSLAQALLLGRLSSISVDGGKIGTFRRLAH